MQKVVEVYGEAVVKGQENGLTTAELAKQLGCSASTIWRVKKALGLPSNGRPGSPRKNRSDWDWSLKDVQLARLHGLSRQRVGILRKSYTKANAPAKVSVPHGNGNQSEPAAIDAGSNQSEVLQDPTSASFNEANADSASSSSV